MCECESVCVSVKAGVGGASGQGEKERSDSLCLTSGHPSAYLPICLSMLSSCSALTPGWLLKAKDFI